MGETWLQYLPLNDITVNIVILIVGFLVLTRRIIWHTDYDKIVIEKDEWKQLALRLLGSTERLTAQAEVTASVLSSKTLGGGPDGPSQEV